MWRTATIPINPLYNTDLYCYQLIKNVYIATLHAYMESHHSGMHMYACWSLQGCRLPVCMYLTRAQCTSSSLVSGTCTGILGIPPNAHLLGMRVSVQIDRKSRLSLQGYWCEGHSMPLGVQYLCLLSALALWVNGYGVIGTRVYSMEEKCPGCIGMWSPHHKVF